MKLCVPRFGCLVQHALEHEIVCAQVWSCSKGFRHIKLFVPRFGCVYFGKLYLEDVGSGRR